MLQNRLHLPVRMLPQPDETTCGPNWLHALYRYWGADEALDDVIAWTRKLERVGTVAVFLACDALRTGCQATIYNYNLMVFDPAFRGLLRRRLPILTGSISSYLYRAAREYGPDDRPDDVRGAPAGHFVVMAGYDRKERSILVADPNGTTLSETDAGSMG